MSIEEIKQALIAADTEFARIKVNDDDVFKMARGRTVLRDLFESLKTNEIKAE